MVKHCLLVIKHSQLYSRGIHLINVTCGGCHDCDDHFETAEVVRMKVSAVRVCGVKFAAEAWPLHILSFAMMLVTKL